MRSEKAEARRGGVAARGFLLGVEGEEGICELIEVGEVCAGFYGGILVLVGRLFCGRLFLETGCYG